MLDVVLRCLLARFSCLLSRFEDLLARLELILSKLLHLLADFARILSAYEKFATVLRIQRGEQIRILKQKKSLQGKIPPHKLTNGKKLQFAFYLLKLFSCFVQLLNFVPINNVPKCCHIIWTTVLIIQVICVLPNVKA